MTDLRLDDPAFERALRATLEDLAPDGAPESLRTAVAGVALRPRRGVAARSRTIFAAVGLAATVVVAVTGFALISAQQGWLGGPGPAAPPPTASPTPATESFTFRVVTDDGSTASKAQIDAVHGVMAERLLAYGLANFSSSASDDRITLDVPAPANAASRDAIRRLLGSTGVFSISQPTATPLEPGDRVDGPPLVPGDAIADPALGSDSSGNPTLDVRILAPTARAFADATSAHVGDYMAVALDGVVVAAPVIQAPITGGDLQISFAGDDPLTPAWLAAVLQSRPLPLPVEAVTP